MATFRRVIDSEEDDDDNPEITSASITSATTAISESDQKGNVPFPLAYHATRPASDIDKGQHRSPFAFDPYSTSGTTQIKGRDYTSNMTSATTAISENDQKGNVPFPLAYHATRQASDFDKGQHRSPFAFDPYSTSGTTQIKGRDYTSQEIFLRPMCLVSTDKDGKFKIETDVLDQIKSVDVPVVVIAIVGLFNTGKSYLMNRLAGVSDGFPLAHKWHAESATEVIWAWCRKHPKRKNTVLLLLDTEGIGKPIKDDVNHDIKLITLAALLCNVLVYNIMKAFSGSFETPNFISEIPNSIQFKNRAHSCEQQDQKSLILPILVVCLRDFMLDLENDGKEITQDEYLESMLKLKAGKNTEVVRFNKPREGIMKNFPNRKCFTFDRPGNRYQMKMLEKVDLDELSESFRKDTEKFLLYMFEQKPKVLLHSKPVTGHMFTSLVDTYVSAIRKGSVPDVDDAITVMANIENERLKHILVQTFRDQLNTVTLPVLKTNVLEQLYQNLQKEILAEFRKEAVFNVEKVEKEIVYELDKMWIKKKKQNLKMLKEYCIKELNSIYEQHVGKPDQYNKVGGYKAYKSKMVYVKQSYQTKMAESDTIMVKEVMNEFFVKEADTEQIILESDLEMTENERKGVQSSPVISKFKELVSKRQLKMKRNEPKNEKPTRRIYVGWKHLTSNVYEKTQADARLQNSGFSNNTEMSTTSVNKDLNPPTTIQEQQHPSQFFHRESQLKAPQEPRDDLDTDSDSSFEMLGTPTLRIRRCLSLRRPESNANCPGTSTSSCVETASRDEDIVKLVDSEDEDIARAIEASLAEYNDVRSGEPKLPCDPAPVLQKYQMEAVSDTATRSTVIVSRRHVLKSAFSALERKTFSMNGTLYVKFSGEIGEDHGGPRREFLRLAMRELQSSNLFEGPDNSRYFSHNLELLNTDQYHLAGRLMALSLAHNGPGFHCMNPVLYDYIATGNGSMENFDPSVLPSDIRDVIEQLKTIETEIDRDRFLSEHGDWLIGQGIQNIYRLSSSSKDEFSVMLQKQYLFYRTAAEITQFTTGLNELNLWNYVKKEPESFKPLFCYAPKPLTKETFFELCQPNFSDVGSNKRADEMDTIYSWELFLQDVEEGIVPVSFEELLAFITGANAVPPCGFSKKLDIQFYSQEGHVRLPFVSTCSLEMWLPRSANQQELSRLIVRALKESQGFLKV